MFGVTVAAFVRGYEEPTLQETYGEEYEEYRRAVPMLIPGVGQGRGDLPGGV